MGLETSYHVYSRYYRKLGSFLRKPRVRVYTVLILSFFTMSFFGLFAIKPTLKAIAHLKREIADSQLIDESLEEKVIHLSQLKEEYKKIENDLPLVSTALPKEPKFSSFLEDLENLSRETEVTISQVKLESIDLTKRESKSSTKISSSLILTGDYSSLRNFLSRLLQSGRIYTVDTFEIRSPSKEVSVLKINLNINTYYY